MNVTVIKTNCRNVEVSILRIHVIPLTLKHSGDFSPFKDYDWNNIIQKLIGPYKVLPPQLQGVH